MKQVKIISSSAAVDSLTRTFGIDASDRALEGAINKYLAEHPTADLTVCTTGMQIGEYPLMVTTAVLVHEEDDIRPL